MMLLSAFNTCTLLAQFSFVMAHICMYADGCIRRYRETNIDIWRKVKRKHLILSCYQVLGSLVVVVSLNDGQHLMR